MPAIPLLLAEISGEAGRSLYVSRMGRQFADGEWGLKFPTAVAVRRRAWRQVIPFFAFLLEIRRAIDIPDAVESGLNKVIVGRRHFAADDAANKLIWLALSNITAEWGNAAHDRKEAMRRFPLFHNDRING
jgi:putative transposase